MRPNPCIEVHTSPVDRPAVPAWFAEVVIMAQHLATKGRISCTGYLAHPFKIRPFKRENSPNPPCKQRRVGVKSDLVNSIPLARMTLFSCDGEVFVMAGILTHLRRLKDGCLEALSSRFARWTKPLASSLPLQTLADLGRSKSELLAENALLRQQLIILRRQVKRPPITRTDRVLLVLLARLVRTWKQALIIVQPDTLLRWHRELLRLYWKRRSKASSHQPKVAAETIALISEMATHTRPLRS
jgi:hypothetical protein